MRTQVPNESFGTSIVVANSGDGVVRIGPLSVDRETTFRGEDGAFDLIQGPISAVESDGTTWTRHSSSGIDSLRLGRFRDDLATLDSHRVGSIYVGDHDYFEILTLVADDALVRVTFTHPSLDIWDHPVATFSWDRIATVIEQINEVEREFGPLTGCCGACGTPGPTYSPAPRIVYDEFIAEYDSGTDIMRAVVLATSAAEVSTRYPELVVTRATQRDLLDPSYQALDQVQLDAAPTGILSVASKAAQRRVSESHARVPNRRSRGPSAHTPPADVRCERETCDSAGGQ